MKTNTKHTPGPWISKPTATPDYAKQYAVYPESTGQTVAIVYDGTAAEANAALIAAAPEMLGALQDGLEWLRAIKADEPEDFENPALDSVIKKVRSAIYTATFD